MTGLRITRLDPSALAGLAHALAAAKLPITDLGELDRVFFRFDDGDGLAGFGGLEADGADQLLRSVVVAPQRRGTGLGRAILALLECEARKRGAARLHLLTDTAAPFFRANGYVDAPRALAPAPVGASHEFTTLCPASATYLVKPLGNIA